MPHRLRVLHKSIHTERQYLDWITRYIAFCTHHEPDKVTWRHSKDFDCHDAEVFLIDMIVDDTMQIMAKMLRALACDLFGNPSTLLRT